MSKLLTLLLFITGLTSCDITKSMRIINNTNKSIIYYEYWKDTSNLKPNSFQISPNTDIKFFGSWGAWSNETIEEYASLREQILITNKTDTVIIKHNELTSFLKKRRKGIFKNYLKIKINAQFFNQLDH